MLALHFNIYTKISRQLYPLLDRPHHRRHQHLKMAEVREVLYIGSAHLAALVILLLRDACGHQHDCSNSHQHRDKAPKHPHCDAQRACHDPSS